MHTFVLSFSDFQLELLSRDVDSVFLFIQTQIVKLGPIYSAWYHRYAVLETTQSD